MLLSIDVAATSVVCLGVFLATVRGEGGGGGGGLLCSSRARNFVSEPWRTAPGLIYGKSPNIPSVKFSS